MNTWANLVTQFTLDPTCQRMSALFVALTFSAIGAYIVGWMICKILWTAVIYANNKLQIGNSLAVRLHSWVN